MRDLFEEIHSFLIRGARGGEGDGEKFVARCANRFVVLVPLVQGRGWYFCIGGDSGVAYGLKLSGR